MVGELLSCFFWIFFRGEVVLLFMLGFAFISVYYTVLGRATVNSSVFTVSKGGIVYGRDCFSLSIGI